MAASIALESAFDVESFIHEYYDAWSGTDLDRIMSYYADDVVLQIPGLLMEGNEAVRNQFARPFTTAFPGNRHFVKKMIFGPGVVTVEFSFEAEHKGPFAGHAATGARISLPGCGIYEYDAASRQITAGRIYFDVGTLLQTITDALVDDRQKSEEALRTNERNLSLITNVIPTFIHVLRADGSVLYVNQAVLGYTGLTLEDVRKEDYRDRVFHPDDVDRLREERAEALLRPVPFETEQRVLRKDGKYRWFLIRYNPLLDEQGRIDRWYVAAFDIEDRKRAEQSLAVRERELRSIINTIPTLAWSAGSDGSVDFFNQRWLNYTGLSAERAQGCGWRAAIHPDDINGLEEYWQSCLASGTPAEVDARMRRFDGSYRWFLFRANPLRDEAGNIVKWYGTNIDIEDRRRGEEALRAREVSWRQIVDNIPGLVATTGAMGEVEFLNRQTLEYFGKTTEELRSWALNHAVHPDDLPRVIEARSKSIETGQLYEVEHRCRRADGVYRWFQVRGLPVRDTENKVTAWYLLLTDIEDRKRGEEDLRARELEARSFVDNTPGLLAWLSPDGTPEIFNRGFLQYLGKTEGEIRDWRASDIVHPDDRAHTIEVFGNAISTGQPFDFEYRLRRSDGVYRWFQARGIPLRNHEGRILHWNSLVTDIEDRKRAEEALRQSEERARLIVDSIDALVMTATPKGEVEFVNQQVEDYFGKSL